MVIFLGWGKVKNNSRKMQEKRNLVGKVESEEEVRSKMLGSIKNVDQNLDLYLPCFS